MKQIKTSLPNELREWVRAEAARRGVSESSVIRQSLRETQREQLTEGKENGNVQPS